MARTADFPLKTKVMLVVACTLVLALSAAGFYAIDARRELVRSQRQERVRDLMLGLEASAREALVTERTRSLQDLLVRLYVANKELLSVEITNNQGQTLARTQNRFGRRGPFQVQHRPIYLDGFRLGQVRLSLLTEPLSASTGRMTRFVLYVLLDTILLVALVIHVYLRRNLGDPLEILVEAADQIRDGHFETRVPLETDDELGILADSFNSMGQSLSTYRDEVESYRQDLEARVEARTRDLDRARQSVRRSDRLSSLGTLAAGLAHELNNPLGNISTYTQLLEEKLPDLDEKQTKMLSVIRKETERASQIVGRLLAFARPGGEETESFDFVELVHEVFELMHPVLESKGVELRVQAKVPPLEVRAPRGLLHQVLVNLILNAAHASRESEHKEVELVCLERDPKGRLGVRVSDRGEGLSPEVEERLFDPFFTTKEVGKGTGLGLSVCYGILQDLDGTLEISNRPEGGVEALVRIPSLETRTE